MKEHRFCGTAAAKKKRIAEEVASMLKLRVNINTSIAERFYFSTFLKAFFLLMYVILLSILSS